MIWKFAKEKKPQFVVNTVLPNANFGTILDKNLSASTGSWVTELYKGKKQEIDARKFSWPHNPNSTLTI